jgi:hypothetical protein
VCLERGPPTLVSITEDLLEWKTSDFGSRKPRLMAVGIHCADRAIPSIRKSWQYLRWHSAVARSVYFACGLKPRSIGFCLFKRSNDTDARKQ